MARRSHKKNKKPRTEPPSTPLQSSPASPALPSDTTMPILSSTDPTSQARTDTSSQSFALAVPESFELHTPESSARKTGSLDSEDAQGLAISLPSDDKKPLAQATYDQKSAAKKNKRSKRKAKKANAQGQGLQASAPVTSPEILPLNYCGPMPGPPTISSKPNVGSPSFSPPLAYAKPTKAEEILRQENEKLREELDEANRLALGLQESQLRLEKEIETWKQKCKGFSEVVTDLRGDVEGMINSRLSAFFDAMGERQGKEEGGEEAKEEERKEEEEGKEKEEEEENKKKKKKTKKTKEKKEKEKEKKGKKEKKEKQEKEEVKEEKEGDREVGEAELKARQEKCQKSCFIQIQEYRQGKMAEEIRRMGWWKRFKIKFVSNLATQLFFPPVPLPPFPLPTYSKF